MAANVGAMKSVLRGAPAGMGPAANENKPAWFLTIGSARHISTARDILKRDGYETYYPLMREMKLPPARTLSVKQRKHIQRYAYPVTSALFPGYLFVRFNPLVKRWHEIFELSRLRGLVFNDNLPHVVADSMVQALLNLEEGGAIPLETPIERVAYALGETVRIADGPFASFDGVIQDLDESKRRVILEAAIFGRPTPVELDLDQIAKR
jgi:transcriptional antiterminator NusG